MPTSFQPGEDIEKLFAYTLTPGDQPQRGEAIRQAAKLLAYTIELNCPQGAECSAAIRQVREAALMADLSIALE